MNRIILLKMYGITQTIILYLQIIKIIRCSLIRCDCVPAMQLRFGSRLRCRFGPGEAIKWLAPIMKLIR